LTCQSRKVPKPIPVTTVETESKQEASEPEQSGEELENYSKNVQKRIKKLTEKYRQEERDREEAVRLAKELREENEKLKTQVQGSQQAHLTEYGQRLDNQQNLAKQAYRDAHDRGDVDKMMEAQEMLSKISIEQERYRLAKQQQERVQVQRAPSSKPLLYNNLYNKSVLQNLIQEHRTGHQRTSGLVKTRS
jgi:hypothetical protein